MLWCQVSPHIIIVDQQQRPAETFLFLITVTEQQIAGKMLAEQGAGPPGISCKRILTFLLKRGCTQKARSELLCDKWMAMQNLGGMAPPGEQSASASRVSVQLVPEKAVCARTAVKRPDSTE